ncbi:phage host-nuclease inhibitor protein Gam [Erythromicrobium ramosum]|uniref:Phage host-nuclease inhibitor protein Gam n=1 Tax=Erythrobacter ramosus TaxID=35811 RepID=A0A6I4UFG5_9SPHN|nr:host-nuclease inhibitor Gam family protein [Erythrobacter ramosus]MBB3775187.1 phage host-nuclease inhibitor protein Gam [Erythrobacter ramosus]MXP37188.1 hypothetical protein [Erythrobacter ramosus]
MPRRKRETVHVPADVAEATGMIAEYVALERSSALERLAAKDAIDRVKAQCDAALVEIEAEMQPLFEGIKAWWEAGGRTAVAKGRKSAEIANAKIGIRLGMPQVRFARKVKVGDVVVWLRSLRWARAGEFVRVKISLDKEAVIKAVRSEPEVAKQFEGKLTVEQEEEFFIDTGLDEAELRTVSTAKASEN